MADTFKEMGAGGFSPDANCYRRGGSCVCGGGVCGKEGLAIPLSPSVVPAGYAWLPLEPTEAMVHAAEDLPAPRMFGKVWRAMASAALASRPAEVDPAHLLREALADAVNLRTDIDKALERTGGAR